MLAASDAPEPWIYLSQILGLGADGYACDTLSGANKLQHGDFESTTPHHLALDDQQYSCSARYCETLLGKVDKIPEGT
jgi:hypothetical protein